MQPQVQARAKELGVQETITFEAPHIGQYFCLNATERLRTSAQTAQAMGEERGTENGSRAIHFRLPVLAMADDLVPELKAVISCSDCNMVMSVLTDRVLHASPDRYARSGVTFAHLLYDPLLDFMY
jgi:hypothetical protein